MKINLHVVSVLGIHELKQSYSEKAVTSTLGICLEILNLYEHDALLVHAKSLISVVDFIGKIYKDDAWSHKK